MIKSYISGHSIYYVPEERFWKYTDTNTPVDAEIRPCIRCGKMPTKEGYDACTGYVNGAISVCCGHEVEEPILMYTEVNVEE